MKCQPVGSPRPGEVLMRTAKGRKRGSVRGSSHREARRLWKHLGFHTEPKAPL